MIVSFVLAVVTKPDAVFEPFWYGYTLVMWPTCRKLHLTIHSHYNRSNVHVGGSDVESDYLHLGFCFDGCHHFLSIRFELFPARQHSGQVTNVRESMFACTVPLRFTEPNNVVIASNLHHYTHCSLRCHGIIYRRKWYFACGSLGQGVTGCNWHQQARHRQSGER